MPQCERLTGLYKYVTVRFVVWTFSKKMHCPGKTKQKTNIMPHQQRLNDETNSSTCVDFLCQNNSQAKTTITTHWGQTGKSNHLPFFMIWQLRWSPNCPILILQFWLYSVELDSFRCLVNWILTGDAIGQNDGSVFSCSCFQLDFWSYNVDCASVQGQKSWSTKF